MTMTILLLGGLAFFLFGLDQMASSLKSIAGSGMRKLLGDMTKNRLMAMFSGATITALVQSSSVTTVLVVGFISAGLMSLTQSVGIIMGANIGSTVTAQLVAFNVTDYALILVIIGFGMMFLGKREKLKQFGTALMGLGLIFFGMGLMSEATHPLRDFPPFIKIMRNMDAPLAGILAGLAFTALVQSSAATTGIVIVLATQGFITLEAGIAIAFGANVGTCVTALLAALGKPTEARRAAAVHVLFNIIGVLVWLPFIDQLADFIRQISPIAAESSGTEKLAKEVPRQIANAHTVFNVANTLVFIWFDRLFAKAATKLVREKPVPLPERARPRYLDQALLKTPTLAVDRVHLETGHLGELILEMVDAVNAGTRAEDPPDTEMIEERAHDVELLVLEILDYGRHLSEAQINEADSTRLQETFNVVNQLRGIADTLGTNLVALQREWESRQVIVSPETGERFDHLLARIEAALRSAITASRKQDHVMATGVIKSKKSIRREVDELSRHLSQRLLSQAPDRAETYRLESRVLEILSRLFFFARHIAKSVPDTPVKPAKSRKKKKDSVTD